MEKRTIITVAGAVTLTVLASTSALAANFHGADNKSPGDVGTFTPTDATAVPPQVTTVYVDVPSAPTGLAPSPSVAVTAAPLPAVTLGTAPTATAPDTTTQASSFGGDDDHGIEAEEGHSGDGGEHDDD